MRLRLRLPSDTHSVHHPNMMTWARQHYHAAIGHRFDNGSATTPPTPTTIGRASTRRQHRQYPSVLQRLGDITATAAPRYVPPRRVNIHLLGQHSRPGEHAWPGDTTATAAGRLHMKHLYGELLALFVLALYSCFVLALYSCFVLALYSCSCLHCTRARACIVLELAMQLR